jgi:hypothetical protein
MDKTFRPAIVNPRSFYLSEAYGITEARRLELCEKLAALTKEQMNCIVSVAHRIDRIADIAETLGEFTFCLHIDTIFLVQNNFTLT